MGREGSLVIDRRGAVEGEGANSAGALLEGHSPHEDLLDWVNVSLHQVTPR